MTELWSCILHPQPGSRFANLDDIIRSYSNIDGAQVARKWLMERKRDYLNEELERAVAQLARLTLHFQIQQAQINYLHNAASHGNRAEREAAREQTNASAIWFYHFGTEVLRHANFVADGFVWEENAHLRSHAALCRIHMRSGNVSDSATTAYAERILADAEAYIDEFPLKEGGLVHVIAQMRRAEIKLIKAGRNSEFRQFRSSLFNFGSQPGANTGLSNHGDFQASMSLSTIQIVAADVRDAIAHLEAAEIELHRHPKARWWWWAFATLKSKAVEYLYTCRLARLEVDEARSSPLLPPTAFDFFRCGVKHIVQTKQITDRLFLSRVLESFNRTILAHALYHLRRESPQLQERFSRARSVLLFLKKHLEALLRVDDKNIDPKVNDYAQACLKNSDRILILTNISE